MMTGKTLTSIVLAGVVGVGIGCSNNPEYHFNGKIGKEQVRFYEKHLGKTNVLEVTKADGSKIEYEDFSNDDLEVELIKVTIGNNTTTYYIKSRNAAVTDIVKKAQKTFDAYLTKIIDIQTAPLNIK